MPAPRPINGADAILARTFPALDLLLDHYGLSIVLAAAAIMGLGGFVKGAVGFALPMVTISGLGSLIDAQQTIGILIIPLALMNVWQTMRQGLSAAIATFGMFWRLNAAMGLTILVVAQLVPKMPGYLLFTILGVIVSGAAALQLFGWRPEAPENPAKLRLVEVATGILAGIAGGLSGVWGPPILFFLIALGVEKKLLIRAQGIAFLIGSIVLVGAHIKSGVLNGTTVPMGLLMVLPVTFGMWLGLKVQDRLDQLRFRRFTLAVLVIAGLNLLRRGLL